MVPPLCQCYHLSGTTVGWVRELNWHKDLPFLLCSYFAKSSSLNQLQERSDACHCPLLQRSGQECLAWDRGTGSHSSISCCVLEVHPEMPALGIVLSPWNGTVLCALIFLCPHICCPYTWLAHCLIFLSSSFQMLFFNLPLMAYLCWCLLLRCQGHSFLSHIRHVRRPVAVLIHLAMALLLTWQVYSCYFLQRTYGTLAFFLSPMRTWLVVLTSALIYKTWTLKSSELRTYIVEIKNCQSSWSTIWVFKVLFLKHCQGTTYSFVMLEFHTAQLLGGMIWKWQDCDLHRYRAVLNSECKQYVLYTFMVLYIYNILYNTCYIIQLYINTVWESNGRSTRRIVNTLHLGCWKTYIPLIIAQSYVLNK